MDRSKIGLDRALHVDWLDAAASLAAHDVAVVDARKALLLLLGKELSSSGSRSAADKTTSVLLRTWLKVPSEAATLRADAASRIALVDEANRLAANWAMLSAAYPFFIDCTQVVGRLLALSSSFQRSEYSRRVSELWGERPTANRASGRVLETLVAMKVLSIQGSSCTAGRVLSVDAPTTCQLIEGLMIGEGRSSVPLEDLEAHPSLFCFCLSPIVTAVARASRLTIERRGGETDIVVRHAGPQAASVT